MSSWLIWISSAETASDLKMLSTADPTSGTGDEDEDRLVTVPVTLDSRDVGHVIERLEHCGGYPPDVSEMLNEKV